MSTEEVRSEIPVAEIMVQQVHCIQGQMSIREAIRFLLKHKISGAPLVDSSKKVLSVVSEGDLLRLASQGSLNRKIDEFMDRLCQRSDLVTLPKTSTFSEAYKFFLSKRIHRIFILDEAGALVGLLSRSMVLKILNNSAPSDSKRKKEVVPKASLGKVLVAEDSSANRRILIHLITKLGFEVTECKDGEEAWTALTSKSEGPFVAILSDLMMPKKSGIELLKAVRASEEHKNLPFIIISAILEKSEIVLAKQIGITNYLLKPLNASTVQRALQEAVGSPSSKSA